jgi:hypothetical protein
MTTTWFYSGEQYSTEALVNAAVLDQKARLDSNPTHWVSVKELSGNASDGWIVPATTLTDSEINSLDATKHYNVSAVISGDTDTGLTAAEATAKIAEHRATYADYFRVNTISKMQEYSPSNADMSVY